MVGPIEAAMRQAAEERRRRLNGPPSDRQTPKEPKAFEAKGEVMTATQRDSAGLREALFEQIDKLRSGNGNIGEARAMAALAAQVVNTVHMEIAVAQAQRDYPRDKAPRIPSPLALTGPK